MLEALGDWKVVRGTSLSLSDQGVVKNYAHELLHQHNTYQEIAEEMTDRLDLLFGKYWYCTVGTETGISFDQTRAYEFITLTLNELKMNCFQFTGRTYR